MVRLGGGGKNETALSITLSNAASRIIMRARRQGTKRTKEHEGFVCLKYSPLYNPLTLWPRRQEARDHNPSKFHFRVTAVNRRQLSRRVLKIV